MSRTARREGVGPSIAVRFAVATTAVLALVMAASGFLLYQKSSQVAARSVESALATATHAEAERRAATEAGRTFLEQQGSKGSMVEGVGRFDVVVQEGSFAGPASLYRLDETTSILAPPPARDPAADLTGLFLVVTAMVVIAGAVVSLVIAAQVKKPLDTLVDDVRAIARGNLNHRTRVRGGGEVGHLASAIDRMAADLAEAQDAEVELGVREREKEVAREVGEALRPKHTPELPGYAVADLRLEGDEIGGSFHEYLTLSDGRTALLVCDATGEGIPGALIGATARAYLRSELERSDGVEEALARVNRNLARDVRRGLAVTALVVVLDVEGHEATVASAGHKLPLLRYDAEAGQLKQVHPEGYALGFDKGPSFERSLTLVRVPLGPGDKLVLAGVGIAQVADPDGVLLGDKGYMRAVAQAVKADPARLIQHVADTALAHADEEPLPADVSLVVVAREA